MNKKITLSFIFVELLIFIIYMVADLFLSVPSFSIIVKFTGISLCPVFSAIMMFRGKLDEDHIYMTVIFLLTVLADIFLLLKNAPLQGLIIFSVVQSLYLFWFTSISCLLPGKNEITDRSGRKLGFFRISITHLLFRVSVAILIILLITISPIEKDILIFFTAFYAISFLDNIAILISILIRKRYRETDNSVPLLLTGMILFLLCDISVALYNTDMYFGCFSTDYPVIYSVVSLTMWFFYLPSQVLIAISFNRK